MSQDGMQLKADKALERDIQKAESYDDIVGLLHNSLERSTNLGITRDPVSGQFVRRDPLTPAAQTEPEADEQVSKTEVIGGREFTFTGTELEVAKQITQAYQIAAAAKPAEQPASRPARLKTAAERGHELLERSELERQFRAGLIPAAEYLQRSGAVEDFMTAKGVDVDALASSQFQQSWAQATEEFKRGAGKDWPGGEKNKNLLGTTLAAMGLTDAEDKVAALAQAYTKLKQDGMLFPVEPSAQEIIESTQDMSPQEIIERWKQGQESPEAANEAFIKIHNGGRLFGV